MHAGTSQVTQLPRRRGEVETPTSCQTAMRRPRPQAVRARCFALALSPLGTAKSMRALGPGATVGVLGTGVPRLACLRPAAWLKWGPSVAHLHQHKTQDPREGPSLARWTTRRFLRHGLLRLAREEAKRSRRVPHEVPMTQAMTTKGARRAPARAVSSLSSLVQRGQAQARGSSKGTHFGATIPRPAPRQGGSHCGAQAGIITRTFGRGRPTLVRISVPDVPLQIGQLLEPFPLKYLGRGPGPLPIYRD